MAPSLTVGAIAAPPNLMSWLSLAETGSSLCALAQSRHALTKVVSVVPDGPSPHAPRNAAVALCVHQLRRTPNFPDRFAVNEPRRGAATATRNRLGTARGQR